MKKHFLVLILVIHFGTLIGSKIIHKNNLDSTISLLFLNDSLYPLESSKYDDELAMRIFTIITKSSEKEVSLQKKMDLVAITSFLNRFVSSRISGEISYYLKTQKKVKTQTFLLFLPFVYTSTYNPEIIKYSQNVDSVSTGKYLKDYPPTYRNYFQKHLSRTKEIALDKKSSLEWLTHTLGCNLLCDQVLLNTYPKLYRVINKRCPK